MVLAVVSDAPHLSETKSRSRVGGHFYLAGHEENPINNGAVLNFGNFEARGIISSRSRNWWIIYQCQSGHTNTANSYRNGTSATTDSNANQ